MPKKFYPIVICTRSKPTFIREVLRIEGVDPEKVVIVSRTKDLIKAFNKKREQIAFIQSSRGTVVEFVRRHKFYNYAHDETQICRYKTFDGLMEGMPRMHVFLEPTQSFAM